MKVFAPYLQSLLDYAVYQNLDSDDLKSTLVNPHVDLYDPKAMITSEAYLKVFSRIIEATDNPYCGLNFGCYLNLSALGLVLEISLNTSSIEQGVLILQKFLVSKFPLVSLEIVGDSENYVLQLDCSIMNPTLKKNLLDMVLAIMYRELKLMLPTTFTPQIRMPFTDNEPYNYLLNAEVVHDANYQIALPSEIVGVEINKNRVKEIEFLLPKFIAMLNENKSEDRTLSYQIRNMTLNMCSPEIPNFEQVQRQFPYSKRTLQRKLMAEGMSFGSIVNAIKEELSFYLKNEKHLKVKDVAFILGYSESSAYLHAVKAWSR